MGRLRVRPVCRGERPAWLPGRSARRLQRCNLPWHRIVNSQGRISIPPGSPGFARQQERLREEGVDVRDGRLDMERYRWNPTLDELVWGPGRLAESRSPERKQ